MNKRLLVTGASGFLGWHLCRAAHAMGYSVTGLSHSRPASIDGVAIETCDLASPRSVKALVARLKPDAVIHAAAVADPMACQKNPNLTRLINVEATIELCDLCADRDVPFLFTSSDLVFDGQSPPYDETRSPSPINEYGEQKVEAEESIRDLYDRALICRLPLMFGDAPPTARSFIQPLLAAMREGKEITLFTDEYRTPVNGATAAEGILLALAKETIGTLHLGGHERISRLDFGLLVAKKAGIADANIVGRLQEEVAMDVPRPADVSLDSSKAYLLGYDPPPIAEELDRLACVKY